MTLGSKPQLGDYVKCSVTDFKGTVTSETRYLNGCRRLGIQPKVGEDGKLPDALIFDEENIEVIKAKSVPHKEVTTGGPIERAPR